MEPEKLPESDRKSSIPKWLRMRRRQKRLRKLRNLGLLSKKRRDSGRASRAKSKAGKKLPNTKDWRNRVPLAAPANFCFHRNPLEICDYFHRLKKASDAGNNLFVDLQNITYISSDAVVMLLAHISGRKFRKFSDVMGDGPKNLTALRLLTESGFYQHVSSEMSMVKPESQIVKRTGTNVNLDAIVQMIRFASEKLFGQPRRMTGVYRMLVEAMANTKDHAGSGDGPGQSWWATANYDPHCQCVRFSVFDLGVGIFGSAKLKFWRDRVPKFFGQRPNFSVLSDILDGVIESRTGFKYRGKGLPAMKTAMKRGQVKGLIVAANDAFVSLGDSKMIELSPPLHGTFLSWEVDRTCL